jgi:hypothetical protein
MGSVNRNELAPPLSAPRRWTTPSIRAAAGAFVPKGAPTQVPASVSASNSMPGEANLTPSREVKHWASARTPDAGNTVVVPSVWISRRPCAALQRSTET